MEDPALLERLAGRFPGRIAVGVDVRGDRVATRGWLKDSGVTLAELCTRLQQLGITGVIVTDIARDGAMGGSNCELYRKMREEFPAFRASVISGYRNIFRNLYIDLSECINKRTSICG